MKENCSQVNGFHPECKCTCGECYKDETKCDGKPYHSSQSMHSIPSWLFQTYTLWKASKVLEVALLSSGCTSLWACNAFQKDIESQKAKNRAFAEQGQRTKTHSKWAKEQKSSMIMAQTSWARKSMVMQRLPRQELHHPLRKWSGRDFPNKGYVSPQSEPSSDLECMDTSNVWYSEGGNSSDSESDSELDWNGDH